MKLKIVLEKSDEGGYTVYVPSLPRCISEGDTEEEAIKRIREAIELYLESLDDVLSTTTQGPVVREITILPLKSREKEAIGIKKKKRLEKR